MSVMIYGNPRFIFGIVADKPQLPPGFTFIEALGEWLQATDGRERYLATRRALILYRHVRRRDVRRTHGRLKLGRRWMDVRHKIRLQCTPAS
jgi:hypothetical protein